MRRTHVRGTTYHNKWGTLVHRRPHLRNIGGVGSRTGSTNRTKSSVIAISLTLTLGGGGAIAATVNASGGTGGEAGAPPPSTGASMSDFKNARANLLAMGYRHVDFAEVTDSNCATHSYGQVREFFESHPCKWVARAYLAVHDNNLGAVLIALSWVGMPDTATAADYKTLVDKYGSGNITELSRDSGVYKNIRYSGRHYSSGLESSSVWNAQIQPVGAIPDSFVSGIYDKFK